MVVMCMQSGTAGHIDRLSLHYFPSMGHVQSDLGILNQLSRFPSVKLQSEEQAQMMTVIEI